MTTKLRTTSIGLVMGKFCPPHAGHLDLIERARGVADRIVVLLCSRENDSIPGELRQTWLRELVPPRCTVVHLVLTDRDVDLSRWSQNILRILPHGVDFLFTREDYGQRLARDIQAQHIDLPSRPELADLHATQIRLNPVRYFPFLSPAIRAYYKDYERR